MNFTRISKHQARKFHAERRVVYVLPCNARTDGVWMTPAEVPPDADFDRFVNEYSYYNCNAELGTRPAFYKEDVA